MLAVQYGRTHARTRRVMPSRLPVRSVHWHLFDPRDKRLVSCGVRVRVRRGQGFFFGDQGVRRQHGEDEPTMERPPTRTEPNMEARSWVIGPRGVPAPRTRDLHAAGTTAAKLMGHMHAHPPSRAPTRSCALVCVTTMEPAGPGPGARGASRPMQHPCMSSCWVRVRTLLLDPSLNGR